MKERSKLNEKNNDEQARYNVLYQIYRSLKIQTYDFYHILSEPKDNYYP